MNGRAPATPGTPQPHPRSTPIDLTAAHAIPAADSTTPSTPEQPAGNTVEHIGAVVYFSSASENTARFIESWELTFGPKLIRDARKLLDDQRAAAQQ